MSRLQRKCIFASAIFHGLLLILVLVGSAFIPAKPKEEMVSIEMVDLSAVLVNEPNVATGGNPNAGSPEAPEKQAQPVQPQAAPPQPAPAQPVKPEVKPEPEPVKPAKTPAKEPVREPEPEPKPEPRREPRRPDPDAFDLDKAVRKPRPAKPERTFDLGKAERKKITTSQPKESSDSESDARAERQAKAAAAAAAARAGAIGQVMSKLQGGLSKGVGEIGIPGPGGAAYASYGLYLRKVYHDAWITPNTSRGDEPAVEVEVEIRKDGTVLSARITRKSGRSELDRSVQRTLDRLKKLRPFPEGSTDEKRTFRMNFNLTDNSLSIG